MKIYLVITKEGDEFISVTMFTSLEDAERKLRWCNRICLEDFECKSYIKTIDID